MNKRNIVILLVFVFFIGCSSKENSISTNLKVTVSILPQKYIVDKIGGEHVDTSVLVQPGESPATYSPSAKQVINLTSSKIFFAIGVPFEEQFLNKIADSVDNIKIIDISRNLNKYTSTHFHEHLDSEHKHEEEQENDAKNFNPHVWLDPLYMIEMGKIVKNNLINLDSKNSLIYEKNFELYEKELKSLHNDLVNKFKKYRGKGFLIYHPSLLYFAKRYDLNQIAFEIDGKNPSSKQLVDLIDQAKSKEIKTIFVQPEFSKVAAQKIADAIGGNVVEIYPLYYDYIANLKNIGESILKGFMD